MLCMGHIGVPTEEARQRYGMNYIFISEFRVMPGGLNYDCLSLFDGVLSSDNSMVCFLRKAFLKSDTLAGLTTSVDLIWCIVCVIS